MGTNIVLLVGNLGADPETRTGSNDTTITTFSVGTNRPARNSEGKTYKDANDYLLEPDRQDTLKYTPGFAGCRDTTPYHYGRNITKKWRKIAA